MGRLLVVGFASGEIPKFAVNMALIKGFSLVGVRSGAQLMMTPHLRDVRAFSFPGRSVHQFTPVQEMLKELLPMAEKGLLRPYIQSVVPLQKAAEAFQLVADRKVLGKTVIQTRSDDAKL